MRDCSSASRAVVSAGSRACARRCSHWKITAANAPPVSAGREPDRGAAGPARPRRSGERASGASAQAICAAMPPLNAPSAIAAAHCAATGNPPSGRFSPQATSSHSSTPGNATLAADATSASQVAKLLAWNTTATPTTACTNSSARSTTPTWQTSNAEPASGRSGSAALTASKTVVPKPLERGSDGGDDGIRRVALGDEGFVDPGGARCRPGGSAQRPRAARAACGSSGWGGVVACRRGHRRWAAPIESGARRVQRIVPNSGAGGEPLSSRKSHPLSRRQSRRRIPPGSGAKVHP